MKVMRTLCAWGSHSGVDGDLFKTSFHTKPYHSIMSDDVESFSPLKFQITVSG